ncbi:hypothetical protein LCGC14_1191830 [marine sediment metagenome]|uniref:Uncharacterized protein n=1 Tax=marine sediment metagenome TaxID=412755 RepID=A0A0F9PPH3_9ZZZZ
MPNYKSCKYYTYIWKNGKEEMLCTLTGKSYCSFWDNLECVPSEETDRDKLIKEGVMYEG